MRLSAMTELFGNPLALEVKPVKPPVAEAMYLNVNEPFENLLGLSSLMLVVVLSHCIVSEGTGNILGVGLTVIVNTID